MLKPKKKITRKEIKRDPLLETTYKVQNYIKSNRSMLVKSAVGMLAVLLIAFIVVNRGVISRNAASTDLGKALVAYAQSDIDNAILQFDYVYDEYGSTKDGALAGYYLGKIYFERGDYSEAQEKLTDFVKNSDQGILACTACSMLADIAAESGNLSAAISYAKDAVKLAVTDDDKNKRQLRLAKLYLAAGRYSDAQKQIGDLLVKEDLPIPTKNAAEEVSGELMVLADRR